MATQSVLSFPCRKSRVLSPKIMNLENSPCKMETVHQHSFQSPSKSPRKRFGEISNISGRTAHDDLLDALRSSPGRLSGTERSSLSTLNFGKSPSKQTYPSIKDAIFSPTRQILSPIRALSLKSPERTVNDEKQSKILQLKLCKVAVSDPSSPIKLRLLTDDKPTEHDTNKSDANQVITPLIKTETPKKTLAEPAVGVRRSLRKLRTQRTLENPVRDDFKENVPPGTCPTPSKKQKPSPEAKKSVETPRSQRSKRRAARMLDVDTPVKKASPKKLEFSTPAKHVSPTKLEFATPVKQVSSTKLDFCADNDVATSSPQKQLDAVKSNLALHKPDSLPYQLTKHALHSSLPDELVGREQEMKTISEFALSRINCRKSGSLYISGAPGTGKSACAAKVLSNNKITQQAQVIAINCMSTKNATAIYSKIASEMGAKSLDCKTVKSSINYLETAVTSSNNRPVVLLLDEMDQLSCKNQEVLYTIFEWPALSNSRLILIGIANALDLTDRILPRLQTRKTCKPDLLNFRPYSKDQLVSILEDRVQKTTTTEQRVIDPMAVQFCARKVSAVAGDARKALDICRRAVEMVETNVKSQQILTSPSKGPLSKVGLKEIAGVFSEVYESSLSHKKTYGDSADEETFPLQQKLVICTLILLSRHVKCKEVTVGKLHEAFSKVCKKRKVTAVGQSEFVSMLSLIETRGIVSMKAAKQTRMTKVALALQEKDVEHALCDKTLLSAILQEGLPK